MSDSCLLQNIYFAVTLALGRRGACGQIGEMRAEAGGGAD